MPSRLASSWAARASRTRRRVHSPVLATNTTVVAETVVGGSTNASTPVRLPGERLEVLGVGGVGLADLPAPAAALAEQPHERPPARRRSRFTPTNGRGPDLRSDHPPHPIARVGRNR